MAAATRRSWPPRWAVRVTSPVAMALSGHRWFPLWAIVHHSGRRSGTAYATPVAVLPTGSTDVFLIGLPWGPKTNWARNVLAAGGATLTWKGQDHSATEPRMIDAMDAASLATPIFRPVVARFPAAIVLRRG